LRLYFLYTIRYPLNLDIGWHLKNGEYLIKNGQIVDTNFYSTLMDGLEYVNLGWIIDGIIYLVFNSFSFTFKLVHLVKLKNKKDS